ncbi:class I SAM-dependent methyltransferase [Sandaracinus amylolyticus]|nr:class I SAM-dependent methyltransferase [Sandaracinus amylolyticus]
MSQNATRDRYTFGDTDVAAHRLRLLAAVYEPSSRAWITARAGDLRDARVIDLGCGPGHTTRMLGDVLAPASLLGLDASPRYVRAAREAMPEPARFEVHDVTTALPERDADLLYCRFLLTHLGDPRAALDVWYDAARDGGALLVEEVEELRATDPMLRRYYEIVAAMQAHHRQSLQVGRLLDAAAGATRWTTVRSETATIALPASRMAMLHALNLATWGEAEIARGACEAREVADIAARLRAIAEDDEGLIVECEMRRMELRRAPR